jgi:hypothetical protein
MEWWNIGIMGSQRNWKLETGNWAAKGSRKKRKNRREEYARFRMSFLSAAT